MADRNSRVTGNNPHPNPPSRNLNKEVQAHLSKFRKQTMGKSVPHKLTPYKMPKVKTTPIDVMRNALGFMRGGAK